MLVYFYYYIILILIIIASNVTDKGNIVEYEYNIIEINDWNNIFVKILY